MRDNLRASLAGEGNQRRLKGFEFHRNGVVAALLAIFFPFKPHLGALSLSRTSGRRERENFVLIRQRSLYMFFRYFVSLFYRFGRVKLHKSLEIPHARHNRRIVFATEFLAFVMKAKRGSVTQENYFHSKNAPFTLFRLSRTRYLRLSHHYAANYAFLKRSRL